jgi:hypothetical protein
MGPVTLSVNIKFICTSFRNRQNSEPLASFSSLFRSEYKWILYLTTMYVYCGGKLFWTHQIPTSCLPTLLIFIHIERTFCINFISNDNVRILCLSCNVKKKVGKLVRFKQKGQKQASFLVFHKCCQGCPLRGSRYISISFILGNRLAILPVSKARTNKFYIYGQCTYIVYKTVYGRYHDLINRYEIFVSQITTDVLRLSWWQSHHTFLFYELSPYFQQE